tara:strand:+ start:488 stop:694 length:207 start_codon:yes stop_codon:yes gene_type:complete
MAINTKEVSTSRKKGRKISENFPKWAIYSSAGFGVLFLVGFIKTLLPLIGMAFLLALIWSKSTTNRRY